MKKVFIRMNNKQLLGAMLGKYAILRHAQHPEQISVTFINVDEIPLFKSFEGKKYKRSDYQLTYKLNDLQSFTLAAFMAPELCNYQGRALVIDPDVFALTDVGPLFERPLDGSSLLARRKKSGWDTSVMMLDCSRLAHWKMSRILDDLAGFRINYDDWMSLHHEKVSDLEIGWNSWDKIDSDTKMLHTTNRLTQPWKTGLKIDFTWNPRGKVFRIIPKEWLLRLLGKIPKTYQPHPDKNIELFFFHLLKDAMEGGVVTERLIKDEIAAKHVRSDMLDKLKTV